MRSLAAKMPKGPDQVVHTIVAIVDSQRQVADGPDGSASSLACSATTAPQESTAPLNERVVPQQVECVSRKGREVEVEESPVDLTSPTSSSRE
jgi:hypothetical protein